MQKFASSSVHQLESPLNRFMNVTKLIIYANSNNTEEQAFKSRSDLYHVPNDAIVQRPPIPLIVKKNSLRPGAVFQANKAGDLQSLHS